MAICFQRYYIFDILNDNGIDYNQVLMVDADTIVHPDCPNFFEETEDKYCGVMCDGCYEWVNRSVKNYHEYLFKNEEMIKPWEYITKAGFPDYIVLFAWAFADEIIEKRKDYLQKGGKFIVPLPQVKIISI